MRNLVLILFIALTPQSFGEGLPARQINIQTFGLYTNPALVLIHGNGLDHSSFTEVAAELAQNYFVVTYDQRGHGSTMYEGLDFSVNAMVADLYNVLDRFKINRAHLLGHSFGARIAFAFTHFFPHRVLSIVNEDMELNARQAISNCECELYGQKMKNEDPQNYVAYAWGCFANAVDLNGVLQSYKGDVLVLRGHPSQSAISEQGLEFMKIHRSGLQVVDFPSSGHMIHHTEPEQFVLTVKKFLEHR